MSIKDQIKQAVALYEGFRETKPRKVKTIRMKLPKAVMVIGHLEYVGYKTSHGNKPEYYEHTFAPGSRPLLCSSADGKQLLLIGGQYVFGERGIVDVDRHGRERPDPHHGEYIDE
jgi:hypothetical protein